VALLRQKLPAVLTASGDSTAKLWNSATGECVQTFAGHAGDVLSAVFSSDGSQVLTASCDGTAKLWDTATGESIRTFVGPGRGVTSAVFSADDSQVLTASASIPTYEEYLDAELDSLDWTEFESYDDMVEHIGVMYDSLLLDTIGAGASDKISVNCNCTCQISCPGGNQVDCPRRIHFPAWRLADNPPTPGAKCYFPSGGESRCIGTCPGNPNPIAGRLINCTYE
jgi:WD40 repeat protein